MDMLEKKLELNNKINELICFSGVIEDVLELMLDALLKSVNAEYGMIYISRLEHNELKLWIVRSAVEDRISNSDIATLQTVRLYPGQGIAGYIYEKNVSEIISHCAETKQHLPDWAQLTTYGITNALAIPLICRDRRLGVLELYNKTGGTADFTEDDIHLLNTVTNQIALSIENARLQALMNYKLEEMNVLISAVSLVNSNHTLDAVLDNLLPLAMKIIDAEGCSILLQDNDSKTLSFVATSGVKREEIRKVALKRGEGIAGWVAEHGDSLLIPDVSRDARFSSRIDQYSGFKTKSVLAVPLKLADQVIGVAEAINKHGRASFSMNDERLLSLFASWLSRKLNCSKILIIYLSQPYGQWLMRSKQKIRIRAAIRNASADFR
jgi:GAF domain-containing protein